MTFERIAIQAASLTLATIVSKVLCEGGGKLWTWMGKTLEETLEEQIARASEQYIQNYADRHGILKVLGMREPVPLESVYTTVQFLNQADIRWFESIDNMEKAFRQAGKRGFQQKDTTKQDGLAVANEKQYLMVLGGPGAGKSTFLRKMGLEALKGEAGGYAHECIPVLLELKNFTSNKIQLTKAIAHEFEICNLPSPAETTQKLLEAGKLLILLDGLDEVPTRNTDEVISQIQNFVDQYDKNRFIVSCRMAAYRHNFRRFTDVAMADFDASQMQQFIHNWFYSETDQKAGTAQRCWDLLQKPENASARELGHTPLLLTLLCLVYDRSQNFPSNRSGLYCKALRVLLEEWAAEKRIMREQIYQGMNTELEEILLSEIAYNGFEADRLFFTQREIVTQIKIFLTNNLNAPRHLDGEAVLNAIAIQQGILVERAEDVFSFSHLTLQEYLTAQFIDDHHQVPALVARHLTDERWQEVFLLVAGLMRHGADELLARMERKTRKFIDTPRLQGLLEWADLITADTGGSLQPAAKRATALFLALNRDRALDLVRILNANLASALDLVRTLDLLRSPAAISVIDLSRAVNLARRLDPATVPARAQARNRMIANNPSRSVAKAVIEALVGQFEKNRVFINVNFNVLIERLRVLRSEAPTASQSDTTMQALNDRMSRVWLNALRLDPELVNLTEQELKALENYLYANWLMVRCKQAAVRVTPATWGAIEARMLQG
jgi:hypothetical protein